MKKDVTHSDHATARSNLKPGDFVSAQIEDADAHDLFGVIEPI